ncbi:MAG: hypothetical protein MJ233_05515 [Mycoplasmoidaceae bacterium]|nr:hypothetical protein [Mycoplasmoidaceae bacterium]
MKTKHILSLLATMPIVAASIPLTLTSCNKQNKDYVDVICENESIVMSVVTVAKNEDADIYIKSKHNDVFINELESVKVGEVPLTEGQYTFGTCEDTSG